MIDINILNDRIEKGASYLLRFQYDDGRFEGEFSSNTFPTCAYALVQKSLNQPIDEALIKWFSRNQNSAGYWGLDASGGSDREATLFAKLALMETAEKSQVDFMLNKIPDLKSKLWIVKLLYARAGYISHDKVIAPAILSLAMRFAESMKPIIQKLMPRLKPPNNYAPPVRLFYTSTFENMFVAEKYTLVPLFLIIELNNDKRESVIKDLIGYLLKNRWSDGSWFRVGLITAISILALIDARSSGYGSDEVDTAIEEGSRWMQKLRSSDGGCREALNLNVWDTVLSMISLIGVDHDRYKPQIDRAAAWLIENQNRDGGWSFSGMPGDVILSDADDTALSVLALSRSKTGDKSIELGIEWLKSHQSADGGWGTYRPGFGDVNCVSITSHVIMAFLEAGGLEREIERAVNWIRESISDDGYWDDLWLAKKTYGTACAIESLIRSGNAGCSEVKRGVKWLEEIQNPDGGWGESIIGERTSSTIEQSAWSTYALLLDNPASAAARNGIQYITKNQNPDGSFPSSCVGIYWEVIGGYIDPVYSSVFSLIALNYYRKCIQEATN